MVANTQEWENAQAIMQIMPQGGGPQQSGIGATAQPAPTKKPLFDWDDPNTKMALISAALSFLQPMKGGQSLTGHAAQALQSGLGFLQKGNIAKKKGDIEEGKLDVSKRGATTAEKSQVASQKYMESQAGALGKDNQFSDEEKSKIAFDMAQAQYKADAMVMGPDEMSAKYPGGISALALQTLRKINSKDMTLEELRENWLKMQGEGAVGEATPVTAPKAFPSMQEAIAAAQPVPEFDEMETYLRSARVAVSGALGVPQGSKVTPVEDIDTIEAELSSRWEFMTESQHEEALKIMKLLKKGEEAEE